VLGGTEQQKRRVKESVAASMMYNDNDSEYDTYWTSSIQAAAQALLADYRKKHPQNEIFLSHSKSRGQNTDDVQRSSQLMPRLEMVLQSPRWGIRHVDQKTASQLLMDALDRSWGQAHATQI
jgi:hypothetical protein